MKYRIREARAAKGWTQAELAERAGVTQQAIQRYEAGTREPRASALVGIAKACGVSISYLLVLWVCPAVFCGVVLAAVCRLASRRFARVGTRWGHESDNHRAMDGWPRGLALSPAPCAGCR